jgi:hypothetical protein
MWPNWDNKVTIAVGGTGLLIAGGTIGYLVAKKIYSQQVDLGQQLSLASNTVLCSRVQKAEDNALRLSQKNEQLRHNIEELQKSTTIRYSEESGTDSVLKEYESICGTVNKYKNNAQYNSILAHILSHMGNRQPTIGNIISHVFDAVNSCSSMSVQIDSNGNNTALCQHAGGMESAVIK